VLASVAWIISENPGTVSQAINGGIKSQEKNPPIIHMLSHAHFFTFVKGM
jgi:hypothetical protein